MYSNKKTNLILQNAVLLTVGTIFSKILGFGREWIIAYKYGAGAVSDAFTLTNSIPTTLFVSLATAISINFIPICSECDGTREKNRFTSNVIGIASVIMIVGTLFIGLLGKGVIYCFAPGISEETRNYATLMLRIVIFSIFPLIYAHIFQGYSQLSGRFRMTSVYGIATNTIIIIFVLISNQNHFYFLSIGYVFAYALGMLICYFEARSNGYKYRFVFDIKDSKIKKIILLTLPLMVEDVSASLSLVVDKVLGSYLESGAISALGYASTLGNIASTMIASAIITATYPVYSKYVVERNLEDYKNTFEKYGMLISVLLAPISAFMFFFAKEITVVIFEHGAFGNASSQIVWEAMACYALGIIPCGIQSYLVRGFYSMKETKLPVIIKVEALLCNIVLNLVLIQCMKHMGIALSTSISYFLAMILLTIVFEKKFKMNACYKIGLFVLKDSIIAFGFACVIRLTLGRIICNNLLNILVSGVAFIVGFGILSILTLDKDTRKGFILKINVRMRRDD